MKRLICSLVALTAVVFSGGAQAAEPLHAAIDKAIAAKFDGQSPAPLADDAAFLRRVWLDLAGRIPSAEETRRFLEDPSPNKRGEMIDRLLAAPTYARRMENLFHVMLMERLGDDEHWRTFLRTSFEANKPWDQMAREILSPDREDETLRGAAFFYKKRLESYGANPVDYSGLTRDVGRLFLGVDLQCAECHNHLFIDDYKQQEFQGLFMVYRGLKIRKADFPAIQETPITEKLEFVSVFDPTKRETGPRVPFGKEFSLPEAPTETKKDKAKKKPAGEDAPPPFSALALLAEGFPQAENKLFARNIVNRLWFAMMGRGLVSPLDMFHSDNPPSHPELLDRLAREFIAHEYDVKWFLRELSLSETYQRSSRMPEGADVPPAGSFRIAHEKRLSAEQLLWSSLQATGNLQRLTAASEDHNGEAKDKGEQPAERLADFEEQFRNAFANEPREPEIDFNATVKASLFLLNSDQVLGLLEPRPGNLTQRLSAMEDVGEATDELYLSVFSRRPTDEERADVVAYLEKHSEHRDDAVEQLLWGMLTSMEFCVNH